MTAPRTAAATEARRQIADLRAAERLRSRGWVCIPPTAEQPKEQQR